MRHLIRRLQQLQDRLRVRKAEQERRQNSGHLLVTCLADLERLRAGPPRHGVIEIGGSLETMDYLRNIIHDYLPAGSGVLVAPRQLSEAEWESKWREQQDRSCASPIEERLRVLFRDATDGTNTDKEQTNDGNQST